MSRAKTSTPWKLAVYVVVRDSRGRILLLRRSGARGHFPGCWELPGGKPAPNESFETTARLEVSEECDLDVTLDGVAGAVEGSIPKVRVAMLILEGRPGNTKVTLSDEHDDFRWLPLDQVCSFKLRPGFDLFFSEYAARVPKRAGSKVKTSKSPARTRRRAGISTK